MNEITKNKDYELRRIEDLDLKLEDGDVKTICDATEGIVENISNTITNVSATMRDISLAKAQVELETQRLEHAFDSMLLKAQKDITLYRESLPILEKNFSSIQARMDRLMDRAMDMICEDVSDISLTKQEMIMNFIEKTNDSLNNLISKLIPTH